MANKYYIKDGKVYSDAKHTTEDAEATAVLNSIKKHNSFLEPDISFDVDYTNELTEENKEILENSINQFTKDNHLPQNITPPYVFPDDLMPPPNRTVGDNTEETDKIIIRRNPILISAEKDNNDKVKYTKYIKDSYGNFVNDTNDDWSLDQETSYGQANLDKSEILINDFIFIGNQEVLAEIQNDDKVKNLTSPENKNSTILHEIQHIHNGKILKQMINLDSHPHVNVKDYYRLCYYDEISATLAPLVKELNSGGNNHAPRHDWFYNKFKDNIPDIKTDDGKKAILLAVIDHWNENNADFYVNKQFIPDVKNYVETHPWGSYAQDNSEDYKTSLQLLFNGIGDPNNDFSNVLSELINNHKFPDPIKAHKEFIINEQKNQLEELEKQADKARAKRAKYGFDEEFERKYLENPNEEYETTAFDYSPIPQNEANIDDEQRLLYREFFHTAAEKDKLKYQEDEEASNYTVDLIRYTNPDNSNDEEKKVANTTHISINRDNSVVMTATKADGSPTVPDQQRFNDLAKLASQQHQPINFGNITTPEYAARLYLACISHNPPIQMNGAPDIEQIKNDISPRTLEMINAVQDPPKKEEIKQHYERIKNKLEEQKKDDNDISKENPAYYEFCQDYDKANLENYAKEHNLIVAKSTTINDKGENITNIKMMGDAEAQKRYVIERRKAYIKHISNNQGDYDHNARDASGKKMNFYKQIQNARNQSR